MQFNEKIMNQTLENSENPKFGPSFCPFGLNLDPHFFFVGFTSIRY